MIPRTAAGACLRCCLSALAFWVPTGSWPQHFNALLRTHPSTPSIPRWHPLGSHHGPPHTPLLLLLLGSLEGPRPSSTAPSSSVQSGPAAIAGHRIQACLEVTTSQYDPRHPSFDAPGRRHALIPFLPTPYRSICLRACPLGARSWLLPDLPGPSSSFQQPLLMRCLVSRDPSTYSTQVPSSCYLASIPILLTKEGTSIGTRTSRWQLPTE